METNLILTAKSWELASQLERTKAYGGIIVVKNVPERTYLRITPKQWIVLSCFSQPRSVPQVLESAIDERICPALGEFYELILKAVRAKILVEPSQTVAPFPAANWPVALKPTSWRGLLWILFWLGLAAVLVRRPELPANLPAAAIGVGVLAIVLLLGVVFAASLLRGAGAEVYFRRGRIIMDDACMLPPGEQRTILVAPLAFSALAAGVLAWWRPGWSFFPLVGLLLQLRPIVGGAVNAMFRLGATSQLSDAEQHFVFSGNRTVRQRWKLLRIGLRSSITWLEIGYGVIWTLALAYLLGALTDMPPWQLEFWKVQGPRLALAAGGSLLLLGIIYLGLEIGVFVRDRALARGQTLGQWYRRRFRRGHVATDEASRVRAVLQSPLRLLPPPVQQTVAKAMKPWQTGAREVLIAPHEPITHMSVILSGRVGVYRQARSGRRVLVHVLNEHDLIGLHGFADPAKPHYLYRTLTPVLLLRLEAAEAEKQVLPRLPPSILVNHVLKIPFLTRISLCQSWHRQAIQRFAELSQIRDYSEGEVILEQGFFSESFYIVFEGEAQVMSSGKRVGAIGTSNFFGEIGLLQNSNSVARVVAREGTRCLCIPRREFLRFVAHNHTVAMKLEAVSSKRLGRPIFPLTPGNFRQPGHG